MLGGLSLLNLLLLLSESVKHALDCVNSVSVRLNAQLLIAKCGGFTLQESGHIVVLHYCVGLGRLQRVLFNAWNALTLLDLVYDLCMLFLLLLDL